LPQRRRCVDRKLRIRQSRFDRLQQFQSVLPAVLMQVERKRRMNLGIQGNGARIGQEPLHLLRHARHIERPGNDTVEIPAMPRPPLRPGFDLRQCRHGRQPFVGQHVPREAVSVGIQHARVQNDQIVGRTG